MDSHGCPAFGRLWLGARSVLITPARPGYGLLRSILLVAELASILDLGSTTFREGGDGTFSIGDV